MRKWLSIFILGVLFVFPSLASAQADIRLATLNVQLWPEYDQPSMLVIYDFTVAPETKLPASLTFNIPTGANLIAVASDQNGSLVTVPYDGPVKESKGQSFTLSVTATTAYHFEYYQPLAINGEARSFDYLWDGAYAVNTFSLRVQEPLDTVSLDTKPVTVRSVSGDGLTYYGNMPLPLKSGEQFTLNLQYKKSSDKLVISSQGLQPSAPVDPNTPGRVSLTNYLPYILGGLGVLLIAGGLVYYWNSGRKQTNKPRRRQRVNANNNEDEEGSETYCPQCGTRAKPSDRFCRTCGARFRQES
jgi:hypothetical protein